MKTSERMGFRTFLIFGLACTLIGQAAGQDPLTRETESQVVTQPVLVQEVSRQETVKQESPKSDAAANANPNAVESNKPEAEKKKVETVEVESKALKFFESFAGVLESTRVHEIKTDFQSWSDLVVEQVVEQGVAVSPGKTILKFKTETLDKALAEAEFAFKNAEFDFQKAELELKLAKETFELDNAEAERAWQEAQDDYQYYLNVELPNQMDDLAYSKKTAGFSLEYSKDELDQLEKMYLEDELTEESEAIVLKRAQRSVESAERYLKRSTIGLEREEKTEIPRQKVAREVALRKAEQEHKRAMIALPIAKDKAEVGFKQAKLALDDKAKKFAELKSDRDKMEVKAANAGIVFYGRCEKGKWSNRKLEVDQKLNQDNVVMTIVDTGALLIRASLDEGKLANLSPKMRGKAIVSAAGATPLSVTIASIANISAEDGKFDCEIMIDNLPGGMNAMPGMGCKLSFLVADRDAVMVKKASVFSDDDGVSHFVYVVDGDQISRKDIVVGKSIGDDFEIVEGLSPGSKIAKTRQ
jgi:HlyD family secretion protein